VFVMRERHDKEVAKGGRRTLTLMKNENQASALKLAGRFVLKGSIKKRKNRRKAVFLQLYILR